MGLLFLAGFATRRGDTCFSVSSNNKMNFSCRDVYNEYRAECIYVCI